VNPADVVILGARTAILLNYALSMPNDKALANKANTDEWTKLSKDSIDLSKDLIDEAGKGKKTDSKKIVDLISKIDAKCVLCHNKFRDD